MRGRHYFGATLPERNPGGFVPKHGGDRTTTAVVRAHHPEILQTLRKTPEKSKKSSKKGGLLPGMSWGFREKPPKNPRDGRTPGG